MPTIEEITRGVRNAPKPRITDLFRAGGGATGKIPVGEAAYKTAKTVGGAAKAGGKLISGLAKGAGKILSAPVTIGAIGAGQAYTSATDKPEDIERKLGPDVYEALGGGQSEEPGIASFGKDYVRRLIAGLSDIGNTVTLGGAGELGERLGRVAGGGDFLDANQPGTVSNLSPVQDANAGEQQAPLTDIAQPAPAVGGDTRTNELPDELPGIVNKPALERRTQQSDQKAAPEKEGEVQIVRGLQQSVVSPGADQDYFTSPERITSAAPPVTIQEMLALNQQQEQEQLEHAVWLATKDAPPELHPALTRKTIAGFKGTGASGIISQMTGKQAGEDQARIQGENLLKQAQAITDRELKKAKLDIASREKIALAKKGHKPQIVFNESAYGQEGAPLAYFVNEEGNVSTLDEKLMAQKYPTPAAIRGDLENGLIDEQTAIELSKRFER